MTILLLLVVGPIFFFSTIGGFVSPNPIHNGELEFMFYIRKSLDLKELKKLEEPSTSWENKIK